MPVKRRVTGLLSTTGNGLLTAMEDTTKFLRSDGVWATPPGTGGGGEPAPAWDFDGGSATTSYTTGAVVLVDGP